MATAAGVAVAVAGAVSQRESSRSAANAAERGLEGAQRRIQRGVERGREQLQQGFTVGREDIELGREDIEQGRDLGIQELRPFAEGGVRAFEELQALQGLLGADRSQEAFDNFAASPGQAFIREEQERAITRNAAATGGLSSGRVLQELQRSAAGRASLDFGQQFQRTAQIAASGQNAATNISNIQTGSGAQLSNIQNILANLEQNRGTSLANLEIGEATQLAQIDQNLGEGRAQAAIDQGAITTNLIGQLGTAFAAGGAFSGGGAGTGATSANPSASEAFLGSILNTREQFGSSISPTQFGR